MVTVRQVITKKDQKAFVEFPLKLYKDNEYFVPPMYSDEMALFTDKNVYNHTCLSVYFLAEENGKVVGRIQGILQKQFNDLHNEKRVRFTRFDAENNPEVSKALFTAVEEWAKEHGMDTICGPLGYSDLDREGLLVEGFNEHQTFEEQYNYEYYGSLIEDAGYVKEVDWVESRLFYPDVPNPMIEKVAQRALELNKLHIAPTDISKKQYIAKYRDGVFDCIDECYKKLYGVVPFTEEMKDLIIDEFLMIVNKEYLFIICDENEKVISFGLCFPGIGRALQKSGGRLTIPAMFRLLKAVNKPDHLDLGLIAILPEYQSRGITAIILQQLLNILKEGKIKYFETNLNLEDNIAIRSQWNYFKENQCKRRRSYIKHI